MHRPRLSIRSMIYLVPVLALDCAWAPNVWKMRSVFHFGWHCLDLPVLGVANALALAGYLLMVRPRGRPFVAGFGVAGLLMTAAYIGALRSDPTRFEPPINNYLLWFQNRYAARVSIDDTHLHESNYVWRYVPLDALLALAGSVPPLALAALSGGLTRWVVLRRSRPPGAINPGAQSGGRTGGPG